MKKRTLHPREIEYSRRLAYRLRELRDSQGLSQEAVAQRAGIAANTYQKYEKGESKPGSPANPQLFTLLSLSRAFQIEPRDLLDLHVDAEWPESADEPKGGHGEDAPGNDRR